MTHTRGPWRVHSEHADRIIVNGCCVYQVREMTSEDGHTSPADVRLMAAAPELLRTLRSIADDLGAMDLDANGWREWDATQVDAVVAGALRRADIAIAKAEGRTDAQGHA